MFVLTARLLLRPPWPEDAAAIAAAADHWQVASNVARLPWPYTVEDARAFLATLGSDPGVVTLFVTRRDGGELIGAMGFGWHFGRDHDPELGYWFTPSAWGQGIATEAGRAMLTQAFRIFGFTRLRAGHFVDNPASGAVLRKLGFAPSGVVLPWQCLARGHDVDAVEYYLDAADWRG